MTSIIVVCYNNSHLTERCIRSIERNTSDYELILIDNKSKDDTAAMLKRYADKHIVVLNEENIGYAPAVNQGIRLSTSSKIVIMNNDIVVTPDWLSSMMAFSTIDQVVVPMSTACYHGQEIQWVSTHLTDTELDVVASNVQHHNKGKSKNLNFAAGFCMLFDRGTFDAIGLFEESCILGADDFELAIRMRKKKYRFILSLGTVVLHLGHQGFNSDSDHAKKLESISWLNFSKKHPTVLLSDFEEDFKKDGGPAYVYEG